MIVVPVRVVILHRVPISTHNIFFYNPLYSPKPLQILQILQILQSYRHLTDNVPAHFVHRTIVQPAQGPRYFFVHLAQVAASLRSAGAGNRGGGRPGEFRAAASRTHACKLRENLGGGRAGEFRGGFAGNLAGGGLMHAGMQELHVFYHFCFEKLKFLGQKKSPKIRSPTRQRVQISFTAWNRVKWQEKSGAPRRRVPASHSPKCRNRLCR